MKSFCFSPKPVLLSNGDVYYEVFPLKGKSKDAVSTEIFIVMVFACNLLLFLIFCHHVMHSETQSKGLALL